MVISKLLIKVQRSRGMKRKNRTEMKKKVQIKKSARNHYRDKGDAADGSLSVIRCDDSRQV